MILKRIFETVFKRNTKPCAVIFEEARKRKPGKADYDYLKFVLFSKPPFDYQEDRVIENILKEFKSIKALEDFILDVQKDKTLWGLRNENLKRKSEELTMRNNAYLDLFR